MRIQQIRETFALRKENAKVCQKIFGIGLSERLMLTICEASSIDTTQDQFGFSDIKEITVDKLTYSCHAEYTTADGNKQSGLISAAFLLDNGTKRTCKDNADFYQKAVAISKNYSSTEVEATKEIDVEDGQLDDIMQNIKNGNPTLTITNIDQSSITEKLTVMTAYEIECTYNGQCYLASVCGDGTGFYYKQIAKKPETVKSKPIKKPLNKFDKTYNTAVAIAIVLAIYTLIEWFSSGKLFKIGLILAGISFGIAVVSKIVSIFVEKKKKNATADKPTDNNE